MSLPKPRIGWDLGPEYEIIRQIGASYYSIVCEALHISSGQRVAIKQIKHVFDNKVHCKRTLREITIMGRLKHPNVVGLKSIIRPVDLGTFNELYIVMDYVQYDLRRLFKSPVSLKEDQIQMILYNTLCGVNYLHSLDIIHRDIKPANILMSDDCEVKVADFGLARYLPETNYSMIDQEYGKEREIYEESVEINLDNFMLSKKAQGDLTSYVATRWYRAPEIILLDKNYGKSIDVWSVGCVLAELCEMLVENGPDTMYRLPLLPGESCYPLSPKSSDYIPKLGDPKDQLNLILKLTGTPSEQDASFLSDPSAKKYLDSFPRYCTTNISDLLPFSNPVLIDFITKMLHFDPRKRISISEALAHPYFDNIRDLAKESKFDSEESGLKLEFESRAICMEELRSYMVREILKYS